jgi:sugar phosphate isomerase/epimerase
VSTELLKNDNPIYDICFFYGFNNQRTFARAFKNKYGMTPTEFKNRNIQIQEKSTDKIIEDFYSRSRKESWEAVRKIIPIGLQVFSVREDSERDFKGTMEKIKNMGYNGVELFIPHSVDINYVREVLDEMNLPALTVHVPFDILVAETEKIVDTYRGVGCRYITIYALKEKYRPGAYFCADALANIRRIGGFCMEKGMTLLYHNFDFDFNIMPDGSFGLDYIFSSIPAELLQAELDICWLKVAGQNPVSYIEKYAMRVPMIHLKDFRAEDETQNISFEFRPIGQGIQEIPAILTAAVASGVEWIVVEQDNSIGQPPIEAVRMSREYLQELGW